MDRYGTIHTADMRNAHTLLVGKPEGREDFEGLGLVMRTDLL
jgi:hypothetical protein